MSEWLTKAISIAREAHKGQIDATGHPGVDHVMRVMSAGKTETEMIVGALHDLIEDTPWTLDRLAEEGFPEQIISAVEVLTRRENESYETYIDRVMQNLLAMQVKLYDLQDHMDVRRLKRIGKPEAARLNRYLKAWRKMTGEAASRKMQSQEKSGFLEKVRKKYPNAYNPWTTEDDEYLEKLYCEGKTVTEMASIFGRKEGGITARIEKLELEEKYN